MTTFAGTTHAAAAGPGAGEGVAKPRVVIVGGGFAGFTLPARSADRWATRSR
jgi:hypothetical protein